MGHGIAEGYDLAPLLRVCFYSQLEKVVQQEIIHHFVVLFPVGIYQMASQQQNGMVGAAGHKPAGKAGGMSVQSGLQGLEGKQLGIQHITGNVTAGAVHRSVNPCAAVVQQQLQPQQIGKMGAGDDAVVNLLLNIILLMSLN